MQPAEHIISPTSPQHRRGQQVSPRINFGSTLFVTEAANSLPEKHCQLVHVFDSTTAHGLAAQPHCERQQSRACACDPRDARAGYRPTYPTSRVSTSTHNPHDSRGATTTRRPPEYQVACAITHNPTGHPIDLRFTPTNGRDAPRSTHPIWDIHRHRYRRSRVDLYAPETRRRC